MQVRMATTALMLGLCACASEGGDDEEAAGGAAAGGTAAAGGEAAAGGAPGEVVCNMASHRAELPQIPDCPTDPETVTIAGAGKTFEVFVWEASHPTATSEIAFPCAQKDGAIEAPSTPTPACSVKGVRPWHSVRWAEASAACEQVGDGWRLCTKAELARTCQGPEGNGYTFGDRYEAGKCNFNNHYIADGATFASEAPTGAYDDCHSSEGVYDANGNLWEWVNDRDFSDDKVRYYQGAGWPIAAELHHENQLMCETEVTVRRLSAPTFSSGSVGFRCCRDG